MVDFIVFSSCVHIFLKIFKKVFTFKYLVFRGFSGFQKIFSIFFILVFGSLKINVQLCTPKRRENEKKKG